MKAITMADLALLPVTDPQHVVHELNRYRNALRALKRLREYDKICIMVCQDRKRHQ